VSEVEGGFLELLVDNDFVLAAYLVKFEEGVVAYWPREALDSEAVEIADALVVPLKPGLYVIVGGNRLVYRYVGLVVGKGVLLFRVSARVPVEKFAERLSRTYFLFVETSSRRSKRGEARGASEASGLEVSAKTARQGGRQVST